MSMTCQWNKTWAPGWLLNFHFHIDLKETAVYCLQYFQVPIYQTLWFGCIQKYLCGHIYVAWGQYFRLHRVLMGLLLMSLNCMLVITEVGAMYLPYILLCSNLWRISHYYFGKITIVIMKYYLHVGLIIHMKRNRTSPLWLGGLPSTTSGASLHPPETHGMVSLHKKHAIGKIKRI